MNKDFPRIMTFLRKERGISQKQAAEELGISQSLLSHYEKGVRECGLDFLIRAADYYEVSTDYLLGRTVQRSTAPVSEITDSEGMSRMKGSMVNRINRRLLGNTATIIFDLLAQTGSKRLTNAVSNYLMCAEYVVFRKLYTAEQGNNTQTLFALEDDRYQSLAAAAMPLDLLLTDEIIRRENTALALSPDILSGYFEKGASSLFNLIQFAERHMKTVSESIS